MLAAGGAPALAILPSRVAGPSALVIVALSFAKRLPKLRIGGLHQKKARRRDEAKEVLDADHYGLEKVKERILEYLAVQQRVRKVKDSTSSRAGPGTTPSPATVSPGSPT